MLLSNFIGNPFYKTVFLATLNGFAKGVGLAVMTWILYRVFNLNTVFLAILTGFAKGVGHAVINWILELMFSN